MTKKTKAKVKSKPTRRAASRRSRDPGPPEREVRDELAKARAGLEAGRTLDDLLADMQLLVAIGLLHPRTPEHVVSLLRHEEHDKHTRTTNTEGAGRAVSLEPFDDHELLGVSRGAGRAEIEAAHRRAILACHPDRFQIVSPAIQRVMTELTARLNGARGRLLDRDGPR